MFRTSASAAGEAGMPKTGLPQPPAQDPRFFHRISARLQKNAISLDHQPRGCEGTEHIRAKSRSSRLRHEGIQEITTVPKYAALSAAKDC